MSWDPPELQQFGFSWPIVSGVTRADQRGAGGDSLVKLGELLLWVTMGVGRGWGCGYIITQLSTISPSYF